MHGLPTIHKMNREAAEANRIVSAHKPAAEPIIASPKLAPAAERLATMKRITDGAKG